MLSRWSAARALVQRIASSHVSSNAFIATGQALHLLFEASFWNRSSPSFTRFGLDTGRTLENFPASGVPFDLAKGTFQVRETLA